MIFLYLFLFWYSAGMGGTAYLILADDYDSRDRVADLLRVFIVGLLGPAMWVIVILRDLRKSEELAKAAKKKAA